MSKRCNILAMLSLFLFFFSCKKEYERPDVFKEDIYADVRKEQVEKNFLDPEIAFEKSTVVILSNQVKLIDSSSKVLDSPLYVYKISGGKVLKPSDTVKIPFLFFSNYNLKTDKTKDSAKVYLENLQDFKIFAEPMNVQYQTVKSAPTFIDK